MISKTKLDITDKTGGYLSAAGYASAAGCFFSFNMNKDRKGGTALTSIACRETLANRTTKDTKHIGFFKEGLDVLKMNECLKLIEDRLDKGQRSYIYRTQIPRAVVVYAAPFWRRHACNRSFFSLFIRMAGAYYKGDLEKAIYEYGLSRKIRPAIQYFLDGHTVPLFEDSQIGGGIVEKFQDHTSKAALSKYLRQPKQKKD